MKALTKILLAATLLAGANYTYASLHSTVKVRQQGNVQDRHISGFNSIDAAGSFDVYIVQGATESVRVEAPVEVIDHIATDVENGVLKIHSKHESGWSWNDWGHKKIAVYVTAKDLNSVAITGSGNVFFKDGISTPGALKIRLTGSGDVIGKVDAKSLECSIAGSGNIKLSGHAESSSVSVSGSGDYTAKSLVTSSTTVHVSGSGNANVNASSSVEASVSGSGDVSYTGGAQHVVGSKSGSGSISRD